MTKNKRTILFISFSLIVFQLSAQKSKSQQSNTPHFIEGIELSRNESPTISLTINDEIIKPIPTILNTDILPSENTEQIGALQIKYAQLLNVDIEKTNNKVLYEFIEDWIGTVYRFGGCSKSGIDCSGFTGTLCREVYKRNIPRMACDQYKASEKINREDLREGDLVFFNTRGGVSHVGVYLMNNYFIHSSTKKGVVISNLNESYYHNTFIGAGRLISDRQDNIVRQD